MLVANEKRLRRAGTIHFEQLHLLSPFDLHRQRIFCCIGCGNPNRAFYHARRSITGEFMLVISSLNAMKSQELSSVLAEHAHEVGSWVSFRVNSILNGREKKYRETENGRRQSLQLADDLHSDDRK